MHLITAPSPVFDGVLCDRVDVGGIAPSATPMHGVSEDMSTYPQFGGIGVLSVYVCTDMCACVCGRVLRQKKAKGVML